jgi:hypothetical protein
MSYLTQATIAGNSAMFSRLAQAAATEGFASPDEWAGTNARKWAASPGWDEAWESALASHPGPDYDPGSDEAVVTDPMILSEVQSLGEDATP